MPDRLYPIEFRLVDPDLDQGVFYLGGMPQRFVLTVENRGEADLHFAPGEGRLVLDFRPGLLTRLEDIRLVDGAGWSAAVSTLPTTAAEPGVVRLTLARTAGTDLVVPARGSHTVTLEGLQADGARGARESTVRLTWTARYPDGRRGEGKRHHRVAVLQMTPAALHRQIDALERRAGDLEARPVYDDTDLRQRLDALVTRTTDLTRKHAGVAHLPATVDRLTTDLAALTAAVRNVETDLASQVQGLRHDLSQLARDVERLESLAEHASGGDRLPLEVDVLELGVPWGDATATLRLRIRNAGNEDIELAGARLTLVLDEWAVDRPWGLVKPGSHDLLTVTPPADWKSDNVQLEGSARVSTLHPPTEGSASRLPRRGSVLITLTVPVAASPGIAHIVVEAEAVRPKVRFASMTARVPRTRVVESADGVTMRGTLTANGALTAQSATSLVGAVTAKASLTIEGSATVRGSLTAPTLAGEVTVGGLLRAQGGATVDGGVTAKGGLTVASGALEAKGGAGVSGGDLVVDRIDLRGSRFVIEPSPSWIGMQFRCTYNNDTDLRQTFTLRPNGEYRSLGATNLQLLATREEGTSWQTPRRALVYRYDVANNSSVNTNMSSAQWVPVVLGFSAGTGDLYEDHAGDDLLFCNFSIQGGTIWLHASLRTHKTRNTWRVSVLFLPRELASTTDLAFVR